jgi:transposase
MAGRRCDVLDVREMLRRLRLGQSARAIAKELGPSRNTVKDYAGRFERAGLLAGDPIALPTATELEQLLGLHVRA